jgi:hypothetical protein
MAPASPASEMAQGLAFQAQAATPLDMVFTALAERQTALAL